jgi:hypothetical protein
MAEPTADGWDVDTGLDAGRGKKMPEIVMGEMRIPELPAGSVEGLLGVVNEAERI